MGTCICASVNWCIFLSLKKQLLILFANHLEITRQKNRSQNMICIFKIFWRGKCSESSGKGWGEGDWGRNLQGEEMAPLFIQGLLVNEISSLNSLSCKDQKKGPRPEFRILWLRTVRHIQDFQLTLIVLAFCTTHACSPIKSCIPCSPKLCYHQLKKRKE